MHDLANRKSQQKLKTWLLEVLLKERGNPGSRDPLVDNFDADQFGAFAKVYQAYKVRTLSLLLLLCYVGLLLLLNTLVFVTKCWGRILYIYIYDIYDRYMECPFHPRTRETMLQQSQDSFDL